MSVMHKNVFNPITLLALIILLAFSSCSSNKRYSHNYNKKSRSLGLQVTFTKKMELQSPVLHTGKLSKEEKSQ